MKKCSYRYELSAHSPLIHDWSSRNNRVSDRIHLQRQQIYCQIGYQIPWVPWSFDILLQQHNSFELMFHPIWWLLWLPSSVKLQMEVTMSKLICNQLPQDFESLVGYSSTGQHDLCNTDEANMVKSKDMLWKNCVIKSYCILPVHQFIWVDFGFRSVPTQIMVEVHLLWVEVWNILECLHLDLRSHALKINVGCCECSKKCWIKGL